MNISRRVGQETAKAPLIILLVGNKRLFTADNGQMGTWGSTESEHRGIADARERPKQGL